MKILLTEEILQVKRYRPCYIEAWSFVYVYIFSHIIIYFQMLFWTFLIFVDVKLIANERGAPEAPPIHCHINFISKNQKDIKKHLKIYNKMGTYTSIYKNPSLNVTWSLSFYLQHFFRQQYVIRGLGPQEKLWKCYGVYKFLMIRINVQ